jgi:hypothetical protein
MQKAGIFFKGFFLLYFLIYVVGPISIALPGERLPDVLESQDASPGNVFSLPGILSSHGGSYQISEQRCNQLDPFLFDMALWKILKTADPSINTDRGRFIAGRTVAKIYPEKTTFAMTGRVIPLPPLHEAFALNTREQIPPSINTPLSASGLSPPWSPFVKSLV